ncbi:transcriptional regulator, ArsR family [Arthrobacter sp. yr096]|uniref:ArsR/SmtB family transcription factor n=1 Tax=Arthrobacter sp. yr096 TaxID=1761750 RepID=UPI0008C12BA7|nr:metalloregulator ArsR/SmtB family transcription factor [Arthrobacter sp. yr096]SEJ35130.1 transcriptional regulator, ArsR family [Arthrobacter sp. yr096]
MNSAETLEPTAVDAEVCCEPSVQPSLDDYEAQLRASVFKALADPNRLRLLSIVKGSEGGEACVCDLTQPLNLGQPTVSHHLRILVDAGLLHREKRGTWAYYSLVPGAIERTTGLLASL